MNESLTWTATEDHSLVEVRGHGGDHPKTVRVHRTRDDKIVLAVLNSAGGTLTSVYLTPDAFLMLATVVPEQGDMRPMWTFEGDELRNLLDDLATPEGDAAENIPPIYKVRFAVDEGDLKWKINEYTWSAGKSVDGEARS